MMKKRKKFDRNFYDKEFADFAVRLDNDIGILTAMGLEELGKRLLESVKRLPFANVYYYARQDPQPGEDFGIDDRKPFEISKEIRLKKEIAELKEEIQRSLNKLYDLGLAPYRR